MLHWKATYMDQTFLTQYNEDGTENKYKDIDRYELSTFELFDPQTKKVVYRVYLHPNQRLIFRRRNFIRLSEAVEQERHLVYLIGWQQTVLTPAGDKNIMAINYIYEDGSVALDDARSDLEMLREEL